MSLQQPPHVPHLHLPGWPVLHKTSTFYLSAWLKDAVCALGLPNSLIKNNFVNLIDEFDKNEYFVLLKVVDSIFFDKDQGWS